MQLVLVEHVREGDGAKGEKCLWFRQNRKTLGGVQMERSPAALVLLLMSLWVSYYLWWSANEAL